MSPSLTDWLGAIAAMLTMLAAGAALVVAWRAPKMAAQFAENLRTANEAANERVKMRLLIFTALMKCRSQLLHQDALAALNMIEVAFPDSQPVRAARKSFIAATLEEPSQPVKIIERYHSLIDKVATEVGFGTTVGPSDIQSGYYPLGIGKLDEAALADAEDKIARRATSRDGAVIDGGTF